MFYCNQCKDKNDWPESIARSHGRCEVCGKSRDCNDVPSGALPPPKREAIDEESVRSIAV